MIHKQTTEYGVQRLCAEQIDLHPSLVLTLAFDRSNTIKSASSVTERLKKQDRVRAQQSGEPTYNRLPVSAPQRSNAERRFFKK